MELSPEQQETALKVIRQVLGTAQKCNLCGSGELVVLNHTFEMRDYREGTLSAGTTVVPFVVVSCPKCGHTHLFNALILGVDKPEKKGWVKK